MRAYYGRLAYLVLALLLVGCNSQATLRVLDSDTILEIDAYDVVAIVNRCAAHVELHEFSQAIDDCTIALELRPDNLEALYYRALAYQNSGDADLAQPDWERSLLLIERSDFWLNYYQQHRPDRLALIRQQAAIPAGD